MAAGCYTTPNARAISRAEFFEPEYWRKHDAIEGTARGRGTTWFIRTGDSSFVLRHYRRGGLMAKISKDTLLVAWRDRRRARSPSGTSPITCIAPGLPVPTPIAARYRRQGLFYRADLITQRIENSEPLAARLLKGPLSFTQWIAVGRCIRRFHDAGVCHADLNAHNILLTPEQVYIIDFDRGTLRKRGWWADTTLVRLYRSLEKVTLLAAPGEFHRRGLALVAGRLSRVRGSAAGDHSPEARAACASSTSASPT